MLDAIDGDPLTYPRDRCVHLLLRAVAAGRSGSTSQAAALLAQAHGAAADQGDPDRLVRREPELLGLLPTRGAARPRPSRAHVVLLGGFDVRRDGASIAPAPGRPARLVKLLALRGALPIDAAVELLWPDVSRTTGLPRLRNVLSRIKATSGAIIHRSPAGLTLSDDVEIDARRFASAAASRAPSEERAGLARQALAGHTGELLPGDRYADWAAAPRERIRRLHLAMLDLVVDDAMQRGDLDEACRLLDAAIDEDPLTRARHVTLADALRAQGRAGQARRVMEVWAATAAEMGMEPD